MRRNCDVLGRKNVLRETNVTFSDLMKGLNQSRLITTDWFLWNNKSKSNNNVVKQMEVSLGTIQPFMVNRVRDIIQSQKA